MVYLVICEFVERVSMVVFSVSAINWNDHYDVNLMWSGASDRTSNLGLWICVDLYLHIFSHFIIISDLVSELRLSIGVSMQMGYIKTLPVHILSMFMQSFDCMCQALHRFDYDVTLWRSILLTTEENSQCQKLPWNKSIH